MALDEEDEAEWEDDPGSEVGIPDEAGGMDEATLRYISTLRLISHGIQACFFDTTYFCAPCAPMQAADMRCGRLGSSPRGSS